MRLTASPSRTTTRPGSNDSVAFGETLAKRRILSRKACAAFSAALPEMKVWREAEVLPASGVIAVSAPTSLTSPSGTPSASAKICAMTVLEPWPMSTAPWCSITPPPSETPALMVEGLAIEVLPQPYQHEATPTPRLLSLCVALKVSASVSARVQ